MMEIPPGANNIHKKFPENVVKGPEIYYVQKEDKRTCVVTATASLLHTVNSRQHTANIFSNHHKIQEDIELWNKLSHHLTKMNPKLSIQKFKGEMKWDMIDPTIPLITSLHSSDEKE